MAGAGGSFEAQRLTAFLNREPIEMLVVEKAKD
jgi:hypothetical protein